MTSNSEFGRSWIDVSVPIYEGMAQWPGNPLVRIKRTMDVAQGESHTMSEITLCSHTGTHIDAPLHFIESGQSIDDMPLDLAVCKARVIGINDPDTITVKELESKEIQISGCLLFKTRNSPEAWNQGKFTDNYVSFSEEAAYYLVHNGIRLVGVDYLSAGDMDNGEKIHTILSGNRVCIIEGLNLTGVKPAIYNMICLPLKIQGADGAPARVVSRYAE